MPEEQKKSLEEILIERLQKEGLPLLVGDEEAVTTLVRRAIDTALFKEHHDGYGYNVTVRVSPVIEAALKRATELLLEKMVVELMADSRFVTAFTALFTKVLPIVMMDSTQELFKRQFQQDFYKNLDEVGSIVSTWQRNNPGR